jgi:putative DNA primase/helicase
VTPIRPHPFQYHRLGEFFAPFIRSTTHFILLQSAPTAEGMEISMQDEQTPPPKRDELSGSRLLDALMTQILRYVVLEKHEARAIALWIVHTHAYDLFPMSPRLKIQSPEPGCGKTTLLDILYYTVRNPMLTAHATAAAIFRQIAANKPTLLVDEADTTFISRDLITILNAGHRRNDAIVARADGQYSVWAPAAFATIDGVTNQLEMRSIPINLRRRRPEEIVKLFEHNRTRRLRRLRRRTDRWVAANARGLRKARPELPNALHNRAADNWRALLAIAEVAGGEWPKQARHAAETLSVVAEQPQSEGVMLLADIRDILAVKRTNRIFSSDVASALVALEGRPWGERNGRGPITPNAIALMLARYGIKPRDIRKQSVVRKGYRAERFKDAFERYLRKQKS